MATKAKSTKFETLEVPFGEVIQIAATPDEPRWIAAVDEALHVHVLRPECRFALFAGNLHPTVITGPTLVTQASGRASSVKVTTKRPAGASRHEEN
jgi:hypothetical protein